MDYIDTSNISIGVGLVVFVIVLFISRNYFINYNLKHEIQEDNKQTILYSIIVSSIVTLISLMLLKQYLVYKGSLATLDEPYNAVKIGDIGDDV